MRAALIPLLCCLSCAAVADPPAPRPEEVRAFMAQVAKASKDRDLEALTAALAPDCRIELRTVIDGREQVTLLTRAEYVEFLSSGIAALRALEQYDYQVSNLEVTIEREPPGATVVSDVHESFRLGGRQRVTDSRETARVERRAGALKLVAVSSETHGR